MNEIKRLPRNPDGSIKSEFTANGRNYKIRTATDGLGCYRFSKMNQFGVILGANIDFKSYVEFLNEVSDLQLSDSPAANIKKKTIKLCTLQEAKVLQFDADRYEKAFYLASIFVVRDDEDLRHWSMELAKQKIDDWNTEGLHEDDFLELALGTVPQFSSAYKQANSKAKQVQTEQ